MEPDDPRHGTHRGYVEGCRESCCNTAHMRYMKVYRMGQRPRLVDATGTIRRVEALRALGWSAREIGSRTGMGAEWAIMVRRSAAVSSTTAATVARVYDELCMVIPTGPQPKRLRVLAKRSGFRPPLAWDDIDDPHEQPTDWQYAEDRGAVLLDLDEMGEGISQACRVLRISRESLQKWCSNNGLSHLYRSLAAREAHAVSPFTDEDQEVA